MKAAMLAAVAAIGLATAADACAESYPTKPIRIIVPGAAGGISDIVARLLSDRLDKSLGQRLLVENRGGAGANLGAELVAKSAGDGYTLCLCNVGNVAILPSKLFLGRAWALRARRLGTYGHGVDGSAFPLRPRRRSRGAAHY